MPAPRGQVSANGFALLEGMDDDDVQEEEDQEEQPTARLSVPKSAPVQAASSRPSAPAAQHPAPRPPPPARPNLPATLDAAPSGPPKPRTHDNRGRPLTHDYYRAFLKVWRTPDGTCVLKFHQTDIVKVKPNGDIVLNTNGYLTHTTQLSMNDALELVNCKVRGDKAQGWLVQEPAGSFPYSDQCVIPGRTSADRNRAEVVYTGLMELLSRTTARMRGEHSPDHGRSQTRSEGTSSAETSSAGAQPASNGVVARAPGAVAAPAGVTQHTGTVNGGAWSRAVAGVAPAPAAGEANGTHAGSGLVSAAPPAAAAPVANGWATAPPGSMAARLAASIAAQPAIQSQPAGRGVGAGAGLAGVGGLPGAPGSSVWSAGRGALIARAPAVAAPAGRGMPLPSLPQPQQPLPPGPATFAVPSAQLRPEDLNQFLQSGGPADSEVLAGQMQGMTVTEEGDECVVCLEAVRDTILVPCGHLIMCEACALMLMSRDDPEEAVIASLGIGMPGPPRQRVCPLCRAEVDDVLTIS